MQNYGSNPRKAALMAALPYINPKYQKQIAAVLRFLEMRDFLQYYNILMAQSKQSNQQSIQNNQNIPYQQESVNMNNPKTMEILGQENSALLAEFLDKIKGKSLHEIMPILMEFKARLPKDMQFSEAEKNIIIEETLANLPDDEKNQYKSMLKILKIM
jgi:hypothetical protein